MRRSLFLLATLAMACSRAPSEPSTPAPTLRGQPSIEADASPSPTATVALSTGAPSPAAPVTAPPAARPQANQAIVDKLLAGYNARTYAAFSRDFSAQMRAGITEESFLSGEFKSRVYDVLGRHQECSAPNVDNTTPGETAYVYECRFDLDNPVSTRVVFPATGKAQVLGLYFSSERLRAGPTGNSPDGS